jgi:hypothetical protein
MSPASHDGPAGQPGIAPQIGGARFVIMEACHAVMKSKVMVWMPLGV